MANLIAWADSAAADFVLSIRCGFLTNLLSGITFLSDKGLIWIILGLFLLAFKRTRRFGAVYAVTLAIAFVLSEYTVKLIVCRERPFIADETLKLLIDAPSGYSFPSSHTCSSFACAVSILFFSRKYGAAALFFAFLVAFSRVYFSVHYFTDVLAGAFIGTLTAIIIYAVSKKIENRNKPNINNLKRPDADRT